MFNFLPGGAPLPPQPPRPPLSFTAVDQSVLGLDLLPPNPHPEITQTSPIPTPNYYFKGARSGDGKGEGEKSETEDNPKGLTLPDDSTQLIIISLSVCLSAACQ